MSTGCWVTEPGWGWRCVGTLESVCIELLSTVDCTIDSNQVGIAVNVQAGMSQDQCQVDKQEQGPGWNATYTHPEGHL
jgi:hypothetical protein